MGTGGAELLGHGLAHELGPLGQDQLHRANLLGTIHDGGLGVRAMAKGLVVRIDTAYSDEGGIQMMTSQPFQF